MSTIKYEIEFFSNWHCGSGLAAGADVDTLVIKDKNGLPYVPGRTIKGLIRDAASTLSDDKKTIATIFGVSGDEEGHQIGSSYFGNAILPHAEYQYIVEQGLAPHLYQTFASTSIDENGIAKDNTLRKIETVVPCKLEGEILHVPDGAEQTIGDAMCFIKRMGTGRNRGYGRCKVSIRNIIKEENKEA